MEETPHHAHTDVAELLTRSAGVVSDTPSELSIKTLDGRIALAIYRRPAPDEWKLMMTELALQDTGDGVASALVRDEVVERLAGLDLGYARPPRHTVDISIMPMRKPAAGAIGRVDLTALAVFLDDVGARGVAEGVPDLQFLLGRAHGGRAEDIESLHGVTLDVDRPVADPAAEHEASGARAPAVAFATESGGARLLYVTSDAFAPDDRDAMAARSDLLDELTLVFDGVDPRCHDPAQRQHLPHTIRTTKGAPRVVQRASVQVSTTAVDLRAIRPHLPPRILEVLGLTPNRVSAQERALVEVYLDQLGIPAPRRKSMLFSRCPLKKHSSKKTYVNRREDDSINVHCLGGHGGEGPMQWGERDLLALALRGEP